MGVRTFAAAQFLKLVPREQISRAVGALTEIPLSPKASQLVSNTYCKMFPVDLSEALPEGQPYGSFDAFFTRELRPGVRPISRDSLVSPADGRLSAAGPIVGGTTILVKGRPYEVAELIGEEPQEARFRNGSFAVVYLAPADYHRVHSPVDGKGVLVRGIPGDYFPVNEIGEKHIPRLFVRNNRVAISIDSETHGRVVVILVGAYIVGRISMSALPEPAVPPGPHVLSPPLQIERGDELGAFHLGSTAVVIMERGAEIRRPLGRVRYGESLLSEGLP
ncbi:MAG: archaetidylserine decarboxylase [Polyangiaceae bacterium]|nr:archaetidylserine decarboxylase [Polyangiaceae bacterium]